MDCNLWIATFDGLVCYDGVHFTVFNTANSKGINSNRITALLEDHDGNLWIGTEDGAGPGKETERFTSYTTKEGFDAP